MTIFVELPLVSNTLQALCGSSSGPEFQFCCLRIKVLKVSVHRPAHVGLCDLYCIPGVRPSSVRRVVQKSQRFTVF